MTNWPAFIILFGGFACIPLYYKIKSFYSFQAILLLIISLGLIAIRIFYVPINHNIILGNNFWTAGLTTALLIVITIFYVKLFYRKKLKFHSQLYSLILFLLYLPLGFFQQIMFQYVSFDTIYYLSNNFLLSILCSAFIFSLYHFDLGKRYLVEVILFGLLFASHYAVYTNVFWLSIAHALCATIYFTKVLDIKALETRLGIKMK